MKNKLTILFVAAFFSFNSFAQQGDPKLTEVWAPEPKIITPGKVNNAAPSDAIILFDGQNLDEWKSTKDSTEPAKWTIKKNSFTVKKGTGNIETKRKFNDYQLHIEWRIPSKITGNGQARGNSGLFLAATGPGDEGYEIQILDCFQNKTYVNGQTASIYKQTIPLANVCKKPGEWQSYDIIWISPKFNEDGSLLSPGRITALQNGVLVQNNTEVKGVTVYIGKPYYKAHGASPIKLQDHGDPSEPISFRNIWVREL